MKRLFLAALPVLFFLNLAYANDAKKEYAAATNSPCTITNLSSLQTDQDTLPPTIDDMPHIPSMTETSEDSNVSSNDIPEKTEPNSIRHFDALYVFEQKKLFVFDLLNEEKPVRLCSIELPFPATNAVISSGEDGLKCIELLGENGMKSMIDISDIFSPVAIPQKEKLCDIKYNASGLPENPLHFADMDESSKTVSLAGDEIRVFKKDASGVFVEVTARKVHGGIVKDIVFDSFLYVAEGTRGVGIYEIDSFGLITHVKQIVLPEGSAEKLLLSCNALYVAAGEMPLYEIRILPNGRFSSPKSYPNPDAENFYFNNIFYGESDKTIVIEPSSNGKMAYFDTEKKTLALQD